MAKHQFKKMKRYWDEAHSARQNSPPYRQISGDLHWATQMLSCVKGKLLDIGSGRSMVTANLTRKGLTVFSVDSSKTNPVYQKAENHRVIGKAERLPFASGSFDHVLMSYVFSYTKKRAAVREMLRVLKPGGKAVLLVHHPQSAYAIGVERKINAIAKHQGILRKILKPGYASEEEFERDLNAFEQRVQSYRPGKVLEVENIKLKKRIFKIHPKTGGVGIRLKLKELQIGQAEFRSFLAHIKASFKNIDEATEFFEKHGFTVTASDLIKDGNKIYAYGLVLQKPE